MAYTAHRVLIENIETLLYRDKVDQTALAMFVGHQPSWLSKVLKGKRGVSLTDLDKIADFFNLTVADLFAPGASSVPPRSVERRRGVDRRHGDRRQPPPSSSGGL